ncbi:DUF4365 domain-containing protein [Pseudomonas sp. GD04087]|uniref:DUF4365 domain-containing protein n=1 Tax=unclassified Pseudomonas TaxID=196821 RepID=UPI0024496428|nr:MULTISPECIES: DUF4365 domain-containing protein [unclassified Pseudomonas]MDH0288388.1 DUF4365 domain-containing protein [Pseudomonas sp. GD04087]MDH1048541.1 DUF4365 domain-containing protein [Pseudomonas sp. GD03903]MDH2001622.1 DUF4365 domain-containing protein [Pseudomonas sp. GD03691]HBP6016940.1 DUF4365 domain-containing protein [Pseudomonas aeruginosa]
MEYPKRSRHGDAGEYLMAYTFTKLFGWPCRLYGVDIGVDGETEVMDANGKSDGDIIKIQVKSFSAMQGTDFSVYVDERHIQYWKRFCLPVIVCAVDLSTEKVYWKQITATEAYATTGESKKVTFDLAKDELTAASKAALERLVLPDETKQLEPLMAELMEKSKRIEQDLHHFDYDAIESTLEHCRGMNKLISQIETIVTHFPWRLSAAGYGALWAIKQNVRITQNDADHEHAMMVNGG